MNKLIVFTGCIVFSANSPVVAQNSGGGEKTPRIVRLLVLGSRPKPIFEIQNNIMVELNPPAEEIPPTLIEVGSPRKSSGEEGESSGSFRTSLNLVTVIEKVKSDGNLRLKFLRPGVAGAGTPDATCAIGPMSWPLIVVNKNPAAEGWNKPVTRVFDLAPQKLPSRSVLLINFTPLTYRAAFDKESGEVPANGARSFKLADEDVAVRFRIDAVGAKGAVKTMLNSSYRVSKTDRLLVLAYPNKDALGPVPVKIQLLTDSVSPAAHLVNTAKDKGAQSSQ